MGRVDVYESDYLENEEIFADLVNGVLYQGRRVVRPEDLREQDGELRSLSEGKAKKTIRDKVRLWKGTILAVFVVENQTKVDYHMVIRAMLSESMAYDKQWKKRKDQLASGKEKLSSDEFISGMRKKDKFIPVITIVVYYGTEKPWDGARTLYELLDAEGYEKEVFPFITNYQLNVFDYHDYDSFEQFHTELQTVFEFLRYSNDGRLLKKKMENHRGQYEKMSGQAKALLTQLTNIEEISNIKERDFRRGEFSMCKAFEYREQRGRAIEIIETGHEFHFSEDQILERLQRKLNISLEEAREFVADLAGKAG